MANTLTALTPRLLAMGLMALRQQSIMPRLVNSSYNVMAAQKGASIDVPIPSAIAVQDVAPANVPPSTADIAPTYVTIPLDQWKESPFYLTDNDLLQVQDGIMPMQASEAIKGLANTVDQYLLGLYKNVYGYYGTAGTTPFTAANQTQPTEAVNVRAILNQQLAPLDERRFVVDPITEAAALNLRAFQSALDSGSTDVIIRGHLGQKLGFDWYMDQNVLTHVAGSITTGLISKAATAYAIGVTTLLATTAASTGACNLKIGDVITFAGDTQTYCLTAVAVQASAATDVTLTFLPGLKVAHVGSEAVTLKASHVVNLAFHRDAFAFATRPLEGGNMANQLGNIVQATVDPISGLTLRIEISREHKRTRFSYDILYGAKLIRPELACRLAG